LLSEDMRGEWPDDNIEEEEESDEDEVRYKEI
jgi:hypothetical protein